MVKRTISITSATVVLLLMICLFAVGNAYASEELAFNVDKIDMDKTGIGYNSVWLNPNKDCEEEIAHVEVSEDGIIDYDYDEYGIEVTAVGLGDVVLDILGRYGTEIQIPVHVGEKGLRNSLKYNSLDDVALYYGDPRFYMSTRAGNKVTVKIGKDKYSKVASKKKGYESRAVFKLKKMYNVGTRVKYSIEKDGVTYSDSIKIKEWTTANYVKAAKKTLKIRLSNVHKGDTVIVKYAGRKYTKKIKKNHHMTSVISKIKVKKRIKKNAKMKIVIKNKYKTNIDKRNVKLKNGTWMYDNWL